MNPNRYSLGRRDQEYLIITQPRLAAVCQEQMHDLKRLRE